MKFFSNMTLAHWVFALFLVLAGAVFFLPLLFAFTYSPFCLLLFCVSWVPALVLGKVGAFVAEVLGMM